MRRCDHTLATSTGKAASMTKPGSIEDHAFYLELHAADGSLTIFPEDIDGDLNIQISDGCRDLSVTLLKEQVLRLAEALAEEDDND